MVMMNFQLCMRNLTYIIICRSGNHEKVWITDFLKLQLLNYSVELYRLLHKASLPPFRLVTGLLEIWYHYSALKRHMKYEGGNNNGIHYMKMKKSSTLNAFVLNRLCLIRNTLYLNVLRTGTGTSHTKKEELSYWVTGNNSANDTVYSMTLRGVARTLATSERRRGNWGQ